MNETLKKKIQNRFNRSVGQVHAVGKMIENERYCVDVIRQIRAAKSALSALETILLQRHLQTCVRKAFQNESSYDSEEKIEEIVSLLKEVQKS